MAKKKERKRTECRHCGNIMSHKEPCCIDHTEALAKDAFNFCMVCDKLFDTQKEMREHSHKEAA